MEDTADLERTLLEHRPALKRQTKDVSKRNGFNILFVKRLFRISKIILKSKLTLLVVFLLLGFSITQTYVISLTGGVLGGFYQSITNEDKDAFEQVVLKAALIIASSALLDSTVKFIVQILSWRWRKYLCIHIHDEYFINRMFYKVISFDSHMDNPDQRITQDVDNFSSTFAQVVSSCIAAPLMIIWYSIQTYLIIGWFAPVIITGYFFFGYFLNKLIMTPIVRLIFKQEKLEGDFRFDHIRVRTWAEAIALYDGASRERDLTEETFRDLLRNRLSIIWRQWSLNTSSNAFAYMGSILNYVIVAIPVIYTGGREASPYYIANASFNCISLIGGFSTFINISESLSDLAGYTSRVADLLESIDRLANKELVEGTIMSEHERTMKEDDHIQFDDVTCFTPTGRSLAQKMNFRLETGSNLLIMGPTGSGKTSILRVLNGLWPFYEGSITRPKRLAMFHLPQKPYLFHGSLRDQILYPQDDPRGVILPESHLRDLLSQVGLVYLLDQYEPDELVNFCDVLSPGEQQLISFARLLFHHPAFAILDEATSSLHEEIERTLYEHCSSVGITLVSVGHRSTLRDYHHYLLQLDASHNWTFDTLDVEAKKEQ